MSSSANEGGGVGHIVLEIPRPLTGTLTDAIGKFWRSLQGN
jgi:hypothetical protein